MICPECGTVNRDSDKFCKKCGNSLISNKPIENANSSLDASKPNVNANNVNVNNQKSNTKTLALIAIALIVVICAAILAVTFVLDFDGDASDSTVNQASSSNSLSQGNSVSTYPDIYIKHCDFYTGSSLSDKSYCSANIGPEHYGEKYQISVLYYRDGTMLNDGAPATKTVDEEGFLHIYTSNAFTVYPDTAIVDIYDVNGNFLTEETYYLEETSGQQSFN